MHSITDPQNCEELNKNTESGRKARVERNNISKPRQQPLGGSGATPKFKKEELNKKDAEALMNKQATLVKPNKPPIVKSGFDRPAKPSLENKVLSETKLQRKSDLTSQRPPIPKQKVCSTLLYV